MFRGTEEVEEEDEEVSRRAATLADSKAAAFSACSEMVPSLAIGGN